MNNRNYQKELDKIIDRIADEQPGRREDFVEDYPPRLLLHSCCAPCSSYVLEYLRNYFRITVFYYNPNITEDEEYRKRVAEQKRLIEAYNAGLAEREEAVTCTAKRERDSATCPAKTAEQEQALAVCSDELMEQRSGLIVQPTGLIWRGYPIDIIEGDYEPAHFFDISKGLEQCPEGGERCFACYALRLGETAKRAGAGDYDYFTTTLSISPLKNAVKLNEIGERLSREYGVAWLPSDFKKRDGYKRSIELSKEYDLYRQDYCGCVYSRRS